MDTEHDLALGDGMQPGSLAKSMDDIDAILKGKTGSFTNLSMSDVPFHDSSCDMSRLQNELEICHQMLFSKCQAIRILKRQIDSYEFENNDLSERLREITRHFGGEVRRLQFELDSSNVTLMDSQETWSSRFDNVCEENRILQSELEHTVRQYQPMKTQLEILFREREELLALVDVQERERWEATSCLSNAFPAPPKPSNANCHKMEACVRRQSQDKTPGEEGDFCEMSSLELSVIGACVCRNGKGQPCVCAHTAARYKKKLVDMRQCQLREQQKKMEAISAMGAYRTGFEEQLARNRELTKKFAEFAKMEIKRRPLLPFSLKNNNSAEQKTVLLWLLDQLNSMTSPSRPRSRSLDVDSGACLSSPPSSKRIQFSGRSPRLPNEDGTRNHIRSGQSSPQSFHSLEDIKSMSEDESSIFMNGNSFKKAHFDIGDSQFETVRNDSKSKDEVNNQSNSDTLSNGIQFNGDLNINDIITLLVNKLNHHSDIQAHQKISTQIVENNLLGNKLDKQAE